jgi:UDP-N-acetylmuramoyl-tripeptide--D-alanyl-D-alanine ligase
MRYERLNLGGVAFICDCYNSNPPALRAALESFLLESNPGRKVVVCGDMLELGDQGPRLHRQLGCELAASGIDVLVAVGELACHFLEGWHSRAFPTQTALHFRSAQDAWSPLWGELRPGDTVLLKGSRAVRLEAITENIAAFLNSMGKEAA